MIDGVCGGIAEYFDVDPVLVRLAFVLLFFVGGSAIIAYIVGMIIIPRAPLEEEKKLEPTGGDGGPVPPPSPVAPEPAPPHAHKGALIAGLILVIIGGLALMDNLCFFGDIFYWFRHHFWHYMIPACIILIGASLIIKSSKK